MVKRVKTPPLPDPLYEDLDGELDEDLSIGLPVPPSYSEDTPLNMLAGLVNCSKAQCITHLANFASQEQELTKFVVFVKDNHVPNIPPMKRWRLLRKLCLENISEHTPIEYDHLEQLAQMSTIQGTPAMLQSTIQSYYSGKLRKKKGGMIQLKKGEKPLTPKQVTRLRIKKAREIYFPDQVEQQIIDLLKPQVTSQRFTANTVKKSLLVDEIPDSGIIKTVLNRLVKAGIICSTTNGRGHTYFSFNEKHNDEHKDN